MTTTITEQTLSNLHQREWEWSRRQRFVFTPRELDPRRRLARRIENLVWEILTARGLCVTHTRHKASYDLVCQGIRVEVKASTWQRGIRGRYQANLHGNDADLLIWACIGDSKVHFFVIPFDDVRAQSMLEITQEDPGDYVGKWMRYYNAWDQIDAMIAAGRNAWQLPLLQEM